MARRRDGSGAYTVSDEEGRREVEAMRKRGAAFANAAGNTAGGVRSVFEQVEANSGEHSPSIARRRRASTRFRTGVSALVGFSGAIRKG